MTRLKDSSEFREAMLLFQVLINDGVPEATEPFPETGAEPGADYPGEMGAAELSTPDLPPAPATDPAPMPRIQPPPKEVNDNDNVVEAGVFRGDRLEGVLEGMCRRGGLSGAVVSDESGLPLAVFNSPVEAERMAAFTSLLGDVLEQASRFLDQPRAESISMDINYEDKAVVRRFRMGGGDFYLMVIGPQIVDERSEMELSIEQIRGLLSRDRGE